jgi:hypothetical protein
VPLTATQTEVANDDNRFKVVVAGRRWGKTFLSMHQIAKAARLPNQKVFYIAPTYKMCKQILWDDLKQKLLDCRWVKKINESDLTITLKNNSKIYLCSADNIDTLRGRSMSYCIMDEAALIDKQMWQEVCRPALSDQQGGAMFITTPRGKNSWIFDLWTNAQHMEDYSAFSFTTLQGGNVPEAEIEAAKAELDEKSFRQEYEASFETYAGTIYYNWDAKLHVKRNAVELPKKEILHVAMDFNVSPLVAGIARVVDKNIHFIDEVVIHGSNTYEMADEIRRRYPDNPIWVFPDASGQARKTSSNTSDHHILRQKGFVLKVKSINPPVKDRIAAVNSSLKAVDGSIKLTVDPRCKQIIRCISSQTYKEGTMIPNKGETGEDYSHMNDAVGYLVHWINPIRRPVPEHKGPQLFGHY